MIDAIDRIRAQWAAILPDIDTSPLSVVGRIRILAQLIQLASDEVLAEHGITRAEFDILSAVVRNGRPMSPTEIASASLTSAPGTSKRIKNLVDSGLVMRTANPRDGRGAFIHLTQQARDVIEPAIKSISNFERLLLQPMPADSRETLATLLRELMLIVEARASDTETR